MTRARLPRKDPLDHRACKQYSLGLGLVADCRLFTEHQINELWLMIVLQHAVFPATNSRCNFGISEREKNGLFIPQQHEASHLDVFFAECGTRGPEVQIVSSPVLNRVRYDDHSVILRCNGRIERQKNRRILNPTVTPPYQFLPIHSRFFKVLKAAGSSAYVVDNKRLTSLLTE